MKIPTIVGMLLNFKGALVICFGEANEERPNVDYNDGWVSSAEESIILIDN